MPHSLFLSYARTTLGVAEQLEHELTALGLTVWRDKEQLRTGTRWPKALGEAIAAKDAFVLLWSAAAAPSDFVELEWTTALALKKPILPCLVDDTPLPASLAAYHAISLTNVSSVAQELNAAVTGLVTSTKNSQDNTSRVIAQLSRMKATSEADVLNQLRAIIGRNPAPKTMLDKWQAWVSIAAGLLTVLSITLAFLHNETHVQAPQVITSQQQSFAGSIWDTANEPMPGVKVSLLLNERILADTFTDNLGHYAFHVTAAPEADVTLLAQKAGFHTEKRYTQLGNTNFNFTISRGPH